MKKYIISTILSIFFSITLFAQDTAIVEQKEPMSLDIRVKSDPTSVIISSEALEKNEALQKTLEVVYYQNSIMNDNLKQLSKSLSQKERIEQNRDILRTYDVNLIRLSNNRLKGKLLFTVFIILLSLYILFNNRQLGIVSVKTNQGRSIIRMIFINVFTASLMYLTYMLIVGKEQELYNLLTKLM